MTEKNHVAEAIAQLSRFDGRLTELVELLRGTVVNGCLVSETITFDANGLFTIDFVVPFGAVSVGNLGTASVTVTSGPPAASAPTSGPGIKKVGVGSGKVFALTGHTLTIYGLAGEQVDLEVYDKAVQPGYGQARTTMAVVAAEGDAGVALTNGQGVVAHTYGYNGVTWDRFRAQGLNADAIAAVAQGAAASAAFGYVCNGVTWDRVLNAAGMTNTSNGKAQAVAVGTAVTVALNAVTVAGASAASDLVLAHKDHTLAVVGTSIGASLNFEVSLDNANWFVVTPTAVPGSGATVVGSAATSNGLYTITVAARYLRANLTAIASGNLTARIASA